MYEGTVRWFDNLKGEGLIRWNLTGESIYIHYSALRDQEYKRRKTLEKGGAVMFDFVRDSHYVMVVDCYPIEDEGELG